MHLPSKERLILGGTGIGLLAFVAYLGSLLRPVAPLSVAPLAEKPPVAAPTETPVEAPSAKPVIVAIAGAVKRPGLLHLAADARVDDAIKAGGGAKANADLEAINLAAKVVDGDQVYVPSRSETKPVEKPSLAEERIVAPAPIPKVARRYRGGGVAPHYSIRPIQPLTGDLPSASEAPVLEPSPDLGADSAPSEAFEPDRGNAFGQAPKPRRAKKQLASGTVSLNRASEAELQTLPGVGPATAQKIVQYRLAHGAFVSVDEIQAVRGIGEKKFSQMRPYLRL